MAHGTLDSKAIGADLERLNQFIAVLERRAENELLLEHLHSARAYLWGAMPAEYTASLEAARETSKLVTDQQLRETLQELLDYLLIEISQRPDGAEVQHHPRMEHYYPPPAGAESKLWAFFGARPTSFGVFYPQRHIIAVFPSLEAAKEAEASLKQAGFDAKQAMLIPGEEMLKFLDEISLYEGLWGALMSRLSRVFATEEAFVDNDIHRGRQGAGFLAIYSPEEAESERIRELLTPFKPLSMQRYLASGIQSMI